MWIYSQSLGNVYHFDPLAKTLDLVDDNCYSGKDKWKNKPTAQSEKNKGPIPQGYYTIGRPIAHTDGHGPYVLPLIHKPTNKMYGRDGFLIHGDSIRHPGTASEGCIIAARTTREKIGKSGDSHLHVIAFTPDQAYLTCIERTPFSIPRGPAMLIRAEKGQSPYFSTWK